jgi:hypothetical protein
MSNKLMGNDNLIHLGCNFIAAPEYFSPFGFSCGGALPGWISTGWIFKTTLSF